MKKLAKFQKEFERLNEKTASLKEELQALENQLADKQRMLYDLRIQKELEEGREAAFEKQIAAIRKEEEKLVSDIKSVKERIEALELGKPQKLAELRDDASEEVLKRAQKDEQEFAAKLHDLKQLRGVMVEMLLDLHGKRLEASSVLNDFKWLSANVDNKFEKLNTSIPLLNVRSLKDDYAGSHVPVISPDSEIMWAISGTAPAWFDYWKLTGEILSPVEIAAKEHE
jgi:chromosome segregation ATPase